MSVNDPLGELAVKHPEYRELLSEIQQWLTPLRGVTLSFTADGRWRLEGGEIR